MSKIKSGKARLHHDLTGKRFGRLVALSYLAQHKRIKDRNRHETWRGAWLCQCDCGNQVYRTSGALNAGYARSCGCIKLDRQKELAGKRFGKLRVIGFDSVNDTQNRMWLCLCDCGKEKSVSTYHLTTGTIKSCGCAMLEGMRNARQKKNYKLKEDEYHYMKSMLRTIDVELLTTFDEFVSPGRRKYKKIRLRNLENNLRYTRNFGTLMESLKRIEEKRKQDKKRREELGIQILPVGKT